MDIQKDQIIGELVAEDYRAATVFKKHGIDFCCQGNRTILEACEKKDINPKFILSELENAMHETGPRSTDYASWPLDLLADYIEKKHHRYVEQRIIEIKPFLDKVCAVHGERHPELSEIRDEFYISSGELTKHMKKEELILFPYIRKMVKALEVGLTTENSQFGKIENPIKTMMDEHSAEGERFRKISELSNNYTPPEDACNTYQVTLALLNEFEQDLHLHIHLENNILFPGAIALETEAIY